jgi:hypothetical protein
MPNTSVSFSESRVAIFPTMSDTKMDGIYIDSYTDMAIGRLVRKDGFVSLTSGQRVAWLYRNDKYKLIILIVSSGFAAYFILTAAFVFWEHFKNLSSLAANAAEEPTTHPFLASADPVQWGILLLIGVITVASIRMWMSNGDEKKSNQGFDLVKMMFTAGLGFVVGKRT